MSGDNTSTDPLISPVRRNSIDLTRIHDVIAHCYAVSPGGYRKKPDGLKDFLRPDALTGLPISDIGELVSALSVRHQNYLTPPLFTSLVSREFLMCARDAYSKEEFLTDQQKVYQQCIEIAYFIAKKQKIFENTKDISCKISGIGTLIIFSSLVILAYSKPDFIYVLIAGLSLNALVFTPAIFIRVGVDIKVRCAKDRIAELSAGANLSSDVAIGNIANHVKEVDSINFDYPYRTISSSVELASSSRNSVFNCVANIFPCCSSPDEQSSLGPSPV